jgi:hypothetical protein
VPGPDRLKLLEPGEELRDGSGRPIVVDAVHQRLWSRVAVAGPPGSERPSYFLKQFVAADGQVVRGGACAESQAALLGRATFGDCVLVPEFSADDRALLAYPHHEFATTDELLRSNPARLERLWSQFCEDVAALIASTATVSDDVLSGLRKGSGAAPGAGRALAFKAFEVRNIAPRIEGTQPLLVFDLGPAYVSTVADVAARLMVSVLLLNWGRPMSRFIQGPPVALAAVAARCWSDYLDATTVANAVRKEVAMRRRSIQAVTRRERWGKAAGMATVGRRYEAQAMAWVRRTLS